MLRLYTELYAAYFTHFSLPIICIHNMFTLAFGLSFGGTERQFGCQQQQQQHTDQTSNGYGVFLNLSIAPKSRSAVDIGRSALRVSCLCLCYVMLCGVLLLSSIISTANSQQHTAACLAATDGNFVTAHRYRNRFSTDRFRRIDI